MSDKTQPLMQILLHFAKCLPVELWALEVQGLQILL
jgi:hypothetical protein